MSRLSRQPQNSRCRIKQCYGDRRFIGRITSIGLTAGTPVEIIQNRKNTPLLLYARDTVIALSFREADSIWVEEIE
ncbi:MAG: ferrous iron transport protein A [Candidatus Delongbacteria bacterium]|nr:ferrous iron transport protein A [Candidatus Delongbacteria bacterium]